MEGVAPMLSEPCSGCGQVKRIVAVYEHRGMGMRIALCEECEKAYQRLGKG